MANSKFLAHSVTDSETRLSTSPPRCNLQRATVIINATHEHKLNVALGEVLSRLRPSYTTRSEPLCNILQDEACPYILAEDASGKPVVIRGGCRSYVGTEDHAEDRLGKTVTSTGGQIESAFNFV